MHPLVAEFRAASAEDGVEALGDRRAAELRDDRRRAAEAVPEGGVDAAHAGRERRPVAGRSEGEERLVAVLLQDPAVALGDGVERLVPTDALPLVLAPPPQPAHRVLQAVGAVELADAGEAARAGEDVEVGVAGHFDQPAVLDVGQERAVQALRRVRGAEDPAAAGRGARGACGFRSRPAPSRVARQQEAAAPEGRRPSQQRAPFQEAPARSRGCGRSVRIADVPVRWHPVLPRLRPARPSRRAGPSRGNTRRV